MHRLATRMYDPQRKSPNDVIPLVHIDLHKYRCVHESAQSSGCAAARTKILRNVDAHEHRNGSRSEHPPAGERIRAGRRSPQDTGLGWGMDEAWSTCRPKDPRSYARKMVIVAGNRRDTH